MTTLEDLVFTSCMDTEPIEPERTERLQEDRWVCMTCGESLGEYNMRQLCGKTRCTNNADEEDTVTSDLYIQTDTVSVGYTE